MIEIIKNILPKEINEKIIFLMLKTENWKIAKDHNNDLALLDDLTGPMGKDYGCSLQTFNEKEKIFIDSPLNYYAEIIYAIVRQHTKYKFLRPTRFYWNYYNSSSHTLPHKDYHEDFYASFVYNLHTNNGGTNINNEFYKSNSGEAIVFPSNIVHNGVSQTDTKGRFNLNCVVELERKIA
jgi:hypothetical protein